MISVVTPSLNQSAWLRLAVASVADQQEAQWEHIVQDSLSNDGTRDWLPKEKQVRAFFEKDAGMYDAINRGLRRAHGDVCGYLNCDEQYLPGALAQVAKFFRAHPKVDVLFGDVILVDRQGQPLSYRRTILPTRRHVRLSHLNTTTCATFFRRQLLDRGFYFDSTWKTIGDAVWMDNLLREGVKMATLPEPLAIFTFTGRNLGDSATSRAEILRWKDASNPREKFKTEVAILWHRIQKALAGAYRFRRVEIDVFTLKSPEKRQRFVGTNIGFRWPSS